MSPLHDLRRLQQIYAYFKRNNGEHLPEGCTRIELIDYNDKNETELNDNISDKDDNNINNWFVQFMYKDHNNSDFFVTLRISFSECTHSIDKSLHPKGSKEISNYSSSATANTNNSLLSLSFMPMVFIISPRLHAPFIHHGTLCALEFMSRQWQLTTENVSLFLISLHYSLNPFTEDSKVSVEERESHRDRKSNNFTENCLCNNNNNINRVNFISSYSEREHKYGMEHIRRCHPHLWRSYYHTNGIDCVNEETNTMASSNPNDQKEKKKKNSNSLKVVTSLAKNDESGVHYEYTITTLSQLHSIMEELESLNVRSLRLFIDTRALLTEYEQKHQQNTKHSINTLECAESDKSEVIVFIYLPSRLQRELEVEIMTKSNNTDDDDGDNANNIIWKQEEQPKLPETSLRALMEKKCTNQLVLSFTNDVSSTETTSEHCIITPELHLRLHNVFVRNHFIVDGKMTCTSCILQGTLIVEHHAQVSCTNTTIQVAAMLCEPMLQEMEKHNIKSKTDTNKREYHQHKISNEDHQHTCKEAILLLDHAEMELIDNSNINLHNDRKYCKYCYNSNISASTNTEDLSSCSYHLNALVGVYNCAKLRIVRSEINANRAITLNQQTWKYHGLANVHLDSVIRAEQNASIDIVSSNIRADVFFPDAAESLTKFSVIMLQSASAYLHNVHILGSNANNINDKEKIAQWNKIKDNGEKRTMSMVQTRGISAEYGAHVVLEHVCVEHFHFGIVLLEHCRAYCTHCLITNTQTGCVAHSALIEFDRCSIRETTNVAILLLKSSKCVVHDKERSCSEAQNYYSHRFYNALQMNIDEIENRQNENEQKVYEKNLEEPQEELEKTLLTNTEILSENVNKCTNVGCTKVSDKRKFMLTFVENVYESKESVVYVHHSTFIAHDVDFTSIHHGNISAAMESVIELERCVMYKRQCPNVEDNPHDKATRAKLIFKENDCEDYSKSSSNNNDDINDECKYKKSDTVDNDDNDDDNHYCEEEELYRNDDDYETDISESESGVYISQSSITMHECSVLHYYCGVHLSHRSSATFCKCGAFGNYIGFSVCHHSHAILTHCGTHHIVHTGVKLIDGSHVTMNGTAHDVRLQMNAQKEAVMLIEPLHSLQPCQPRTLCLESHRESHEHYHHCCCYNNHEQETIYSAIYTGRVQAIECHNSILRAHGVCIWVGQSSGVNAHGWSSNDHDKKTNNSDYDASNNYDNNKEGWRDAKVLAYNAENVNSVTLEKCLIKQPARCTVCRHEHTDSIHKLLEIVRHTCKCHVKHTENVKNIEMIDSDNNENTMNGCTVNTKYHLLPPGVAIKMWSGVHGQLTECEVRHAPIGALLIGPTTQIEMHTSTFRHCTVAISVDGSLCKLHKCTSVDVQHALHLSSSARAIIRRGSFHSHASGIRACDSSTLFLFGEVYIYGFTQFGLQAESGSHIENDSSYNSNSKVSIIPCEECQKYEYDKYDKKKNKQIAKQGTFMDNTSSINSSKNKRKIKYDRDNNSCEVKNDIVSQRFDNFDTWCVRVSTGGSIYLQNSIIGTTLKKESQFRKSKNDKNNCTKSNDAQRKRHDKEIYTHYVNGVHADTFGCLTLCHCIIQCSTVYYYLDHRHRKGVTDTVCENVQENKTFNETENKLPLQCDLELYQPVCVRVCNNGNVLLMSCVVWDNCSGMAMSVSDHGVCRVDGKAQMHNESEENTLTNTSLIRGVCFVKESECTIKHTVIQPVCLACTYIANNMANNTLQSTTMNMETITQNNSEQIKEDLRYSCFSITSGAQCVIEHCELDLHILERYPNDFMQSSNLWNNLLSVFTVNGGNDTSLSLGHMTIVSNTKKQDQTSQEELELHVKLIYASNGAHITMHHVDTNVSVCAILLTLHLSSSSVLSICEKTLLSLISLHEKQKETQQQEKKLLSNEEIKSELNNTLHIKVDNSALLSSPKIPIHSTIIFCNHATVYIRSHSDFINNSCNHKSERRSSGSCWYSILKELRYCSDCKQTNAVQLSDKYNAIITLTEHSVLESDIDLSSLMCYTLLVHDVDSTNTIHYVNSTHVGESFALVHQVQRAWQEIIHVCRKQLMQNKQKIQNVYCTTTALLEHVNVKCYESIKMEIQNNDAKVMESMNELESEIQHCQQQQREYKTLKLNTNQRSGNVLIKVLVIGTAITLLLYSVVRLSSREAG